MSNTRTIEELVHDVCQIILIKTDQINNADIDSFIRSLSKSDIKTLIQYSNDNSKIRIKSITQGEIQTYIKSFGNNKGEGGAEACNPFDFDQGSNYDDFINNFGSEYLASHNHLNYPEVFTCVFECIKESSETYRLFDAFLATHTNTVTSSIKAILLVLFKKPQNQL